MCANVLVLYKNINENADLLCSALTFSSAVSAFLAPRETFCLLVFSKMSLNARLFMRLKLLIHHQMIPFHHKWCLPDCTAAPFKVEQENSNEKLENEK